jgi:hypothetical protein
VLSPKVVEPVEIRFRMKGMYKTYMNWEGVIDALARTIEYHMRLYGLTEVEVSRVREGELDLGKGENK